MSIEPYCIGVPDVKDDGIKESWQRTALSSFPIFVLKEITIHLSGFSVLSLYSCGNALLNHKLRKAGAMTVFSVHYGLDHRLPFFDWRNRNFRSIAIFRSLRRLEFVGFAHHSFRNFTTLIITQLAPTLTSIRFDFLEALTMWIDLRPETYGVKTLSPHDLKLLKPRALELDSIFPQLEELHLWSAYWDRYSIYPSSKQSYTFNWSNVMRGLFIKHIPSTVWKMKIWTDEVPISAAKLMPPHLETLEWELDEHSDPEWPDLALGSSLPRELLDLKLVGLCGSSTHPDIFDHLNDLPPSLTYLELSELGVDTTHFLETEPESQIEVPALPTQLTTLIIHHSVRWLTYAMIATLPRTLTKLDINITLINLKDDCISAFPRSLTILHLNRLARADSRTKFTGACLLDLPRSLVEFSSGSTEKWPWSAVEYLPSTLRLLIHPIWKYASTPYDDDAEVAVASKYWKDKAAETQCVLNHLKWGDLDRKPS